MPGNVNIGEPWGFSPLGTGDLRDPEEISGNSLVPLVVNNAPASAEDMRCGLDPWVRKITWRMAQQPTPVFLSGESHGHRSLAGYSNTTERLSTHAYKDLEG